jgi:DNA-binding MarR family transcriptional regulator
MSGGLDSRFASGEESPGFMLWRVTNRWQAAIRRALKPFGITHVQFVLLAALTWAPEEDGITQTELSQRIRVDSMMVSQVLRALEEKGFVTRSRDQADGRAFRVTPTAEGAALARVANRAVEDADLAFFGPRAREALPLIEHLGELDRP